MEPDPCMPSAVVRIAPCDTIRTAGSDVVSPTGDGMSADGLAFDALADPTRRAILQLLAEEGETSAGRLAAGIDSLSRTAVSSHLRILRTAGLVAERRDGRFRLYSLESGPVDEVMSFMASLYRRSLADLKTGIDAAGREGSG